MPYFGEIYVQDENGKLVPEVSLSRQRFTEEDRKRANRNRDRHTRAWYARELLKTHAGPSRVDQGTAGGFARLWPAQGLGPEALAGQEIACGLGG